MIRSLLQQAHNDCSSSSSFNECKISNSLLQCYTSLIRAVSDFQSNEYSYTGNIVILEWLTANSEEKQIQDLIQLVVSDVEKWVVDFVQQDIIQQSSFRNSELLGSKNLNCF